MTFEFAYIIQGRPTHKRECASLEAAISYGCQLAQMNGATWVEIHAPDNKVHFREFHDGQWIEALNQ